MKTKAEQAVAVEAMRDPVTVLNRLGSFLLPISSVCPEEAVPLAEVAPELAGEAERREEKEKRKAERRQRQTVIGGD